MVDDPHGRSKLNRRRIVVVLSDLHAGHRLGLLNPDTVLLEEDEQGQIKERKPELGPNQRYLWQLYTQHIEQVMALAGDDEITVIVNGDLTQGIKYADGLFAFSVEDQIIVAHDCLVPWLDAGVKVLRVVRGTSSHTVDGSTEGLIARLLAERYSGRDIRALGHGFFAIGGVTFDVAHHGPSGGIRLWTSGNQARYYLRSLMLEEIAVRNDPPNVVVRSHYHTYLPPERVHVSIWQSEIVLTPSYCAMNAHARQATRSKHK